MKRVAIAGPQGADWPYVYTSAYPASPGSDGSKEFVHAVGTAYRPQVTTPNQPQVLESLEGEQVCWDKATLSAAILASRGTGIAPELLEGILPRDVNPPIGNANRWGKPVYVSPESNEDPLLISAFATWIHLYGRSNDGRPSLIRLPFAPFVVETLGEWGWEPIASWIVMTTTQYVYSMAYPPSGPPSERFDETRQGFLDMPLLSLRAALRSLRASGPLTVRDLTDLVGLGYGSLHEVVDAIDEPQLIRFVPLLARLLADMGLTSLALSIPVTDPRAAPDVMLDYGAIIRSSREVDPRTFSVITLLPLGVSPLRYDNLVGPNVRRIRDIAIAPPIGRRDIPILTAMLALGVQDVLSILSSTTLPGYRAGSRRETPRKVPPTSPWELDDLPEERLASFRGKMDEGIMLELRKIVADTEEWVSIGLISEQQRTAIARLADEHGFDQRADPRGSNFWLVRFRER